MNHLRMMKWVFSASGVMAGVALLAGCGQVSQQKSGITGAAIGAVAGGVGMGALAKKQGARGSDLVAPVAFGAFGGAALGNALGQQAGTPGVYKTEVPNE